MCGYLNTISNGIYPEACACVWYVIFGSSDLPNPKQTKAGKVTFVPCKYKNDCAFVQWNAFVE